MLTIRLSRIGKNRQPSFKVVLQERTASAKGKFQEDLGYYRPAVTPKEFKVNLERVKHWISVGAMPSDTVAGLLKRNGVDGMDKFIAPRNKKRKKKGAEEEVATAPAPAPAPAPAVPATEAKKEEVKKEEPKQEEAKPAEAPAPASEAPAAPAAPSEPAPQQ